MDTYYLDDIKLGQQFVTGGITMTEADIIDFALRYDPKPFHLDVNAATASPFWRVDCHRVSKYGNLF